MFQVIPVAAWDLVGLTPATTVEESIARTQERYERAVSAYAEWPLPNDSDDDNNPDNNPRLDTRGDISRVSDRGTARLLLDMPIDGIEEVLLDPRTDAFAIVGTSNSPGDPNALCHRPGDYDFALMDWMRFLYTAQERPGSLSDEAWQVFFDRILTERGNASYETYVITCAGVGVTIGDTENHILMGAAAQYLTNQLLRARNQVERDDPLYDNALNGNDAWMLEHLHELTIENIYEYNSRPYQIFTMLALHNLAHYAENPEVALAALNLSTMLTGVYAIQSNGLRRFPPFRRQPVYIQPDSIDQSQGWLHHRGDNMVERMIFLAGNHTFLEPYGFQFPRGRGGSYIFRAAAYDYRMERTLLALAVDKAAEPYWVAIHHQNVELYSSSASLTVGGGGFFQEPDFPLVMLDGMEIDPNSLAGLGGEFEFGEAGWGRALTLMPTREPTDDQRNLPRFIGHADLVERSNTCLGPGFVCGLAPEPGNLLGAQLDACAQEDGNWRFFDFTAESCPLDWGFYMAWYQVACNSDLCTARSANGTYGLAEFAEPAGVAFEAWRAAVLAENPGPFASEGVQTYTTQAGDVIAFEINPDGAEPRMVSSLVSLNGESFERDMRRWPFARGNALQSSTPGRFAFNSQSENTRLLIDLTDPEHPRSWEVPMPELTQVPAAGSPNGVWFDDSEALIPRVGIKRLELFGDGTRLTGLRTTWRSNLQASHGDTEDDPVASLVLEQEEAIETVGWRATDDEGVTLLEVATSAGQTLRVGEGEANQNFTAPDGEMVAAFWGRADATAIHRLGLTTAPALLTCSDSTQCGPTDSCVAGRCEPMEVEPGDDAGMDEDTSGDTDPMDSDSVEPDTAQPDAVEDDTVQPDTPGPDTSGSGANISGGSSGGCATLHGQGTTIPLGSLVLVLMGLTAVWRRQR
ncbi:MAG: hypothetical protein AAFS10_08880 [Myxococcota bacterium]